MGLPYSQLFVALSQRQENITADVARREPCMYQRGVSLCVSVYCVADLLFELGAQGKQNLQGMFQQPGDKVRLAQVQGFCSTEGVLEAYSE